MFYVLSRDSCAKRSHTVQRAMDSVFHALASPARRQLLDRLFEDDGLSLGALCERLDMTRFGVMKHLRVLEAANLVVPQRVGREKRHYLNAVPIREIHDRWVSKYAEPWTRSLVAMKSALEQEGDTVTHEAAGATEDRRHVFAIYIRTTPEALWEAITSGARTRDYFHETSVESSWEVGAPVRYLSDGDRLEVDGEVLEVDRPRRLAYTWHVNYSPEMALEVPSRVTWEIEPLGAVCKVTLTHDRFPEGSQVFTHVAPDGWAHVLSGMKTLLETGQPLEIGAA